MTTYTDAFGGATIPSADESYKYWGLTADSTWYWPYSSDTNTLAKINEVSAAAGLSITLPAANIVSVGEEFLIRNTGSQTFTVKDNGGSSIGTLAAGEVKYFYVQDNSTAAGTWRVFTFGTGTSSADASALASYGLEASGGKLVVDSTTSTTSSNFTLATADRFSTYVYTGGTGTATLPLVATATNGYAVLIRNGGTGTLTITPQTSELIDGAVNKTLSPEESAIVVCSGTAWYSIGYGRSVSFTFTQLPIDLTGIASVTITSAQAANKLWNFYNTPSGNVTVTIPAVASIYYIKVDAIGAYTVTFTTGSGTTYLMNANERAIIFCDATNVVSAQTAALTSTVSLADGSAASPSLKFTLDTTTGLYRAASGSIGFTSAGSTVGTVTATGLNAMGVGATTPAGGAFTTLSASGAFSLTGDQVQVAEGGTGANTAANARTNLGVTATGADTTYCYRTNNLSDVTASTARTNLAVASTNELQLQTFQAFTTGGTSTAYTLTPAPAIAANAANLRFRVNFHTAAGSNPTLAVSGKAALNLKFRDGAGTKQFVTNFHVPNGWISDVENDGTDWVVIQPAIYQGAPTINFFAQNVTPSALLDISGASAGQIKFPSTQNPSADANTLDDYKEGTFTPTIIGSSTAGTGTYTTQAGRYTKIGNLVTVNVNLSWTAHTGTGNMQIGGIPYTSASDSIAYGVGEWLTLASITGVPYFYIGNSFTTIVAIGLNTTTGTSTAVPIDTSASVFFSLSYRV